MWDYYKERTSQDCWWDQVVTHVKSPAKYRVCHEKPLLKDKERKEEGQVAIGLFPCLLQKTGMSSDMADRVDKSKTWTLLSLLDLFAIYVLMLQ